MSKQKYIVHVAIGATACQEVSTSSVDKAIDMALRRCSPSLCHYCSREVELGEPYEVTVTDEHGNELETREV